MFDQYKSLYVVKYDGSISMGKPNDFTYKDLLDANLIIGSTESKSKILKFRNGFSN